MKACPLCKNSYEDWVEFCFQDGMPLLVQASAAPPPAPKMPTLESAPSLPPEMMDSPPQWDAFDAPEPTIIRMAKLQAAQAAKHAPAASSPVVSAYDAPSPPMARGEDLPAARSIATPILAPLEAVGSAPTEEALRELEPPRSAPVVRRPPQEPTAPVAPVEAPKVVVAPAPSPLDELDFPSGDEDNVATRPMATPQPDRPTARDREREKGGGVAPAAAGLGIAMMGTIAIGVVLLVGGGLFWYSSQKKPDHVEPPHPTTVTAPTPKPVEPPKPPPVPEPVVPEPVVPEPVVPEPVVVPPPVPPPVVAPPVVKPPRVTPPGKPPPTAAVVTPPKDPPGTKPPPAATSPWGTAPAAGTGPSNTSENPWGAASDTSTGKLTINSDPPGAQVTVDDKVRGTAPLSVDLPYGKHKVKVSMAGHKAETSDVTINVQQMSVPFHLAAEITTGILNVFGPTGASVFIDGNDMGPLPLSMQVPEGVHTMKLVQADGKGCQTTKDVRFSAAGRPAVVNLSACE